jgi:hypothetical protein
MYYNTIVFLYQIALHPGAKVKRLSGNIIFRFAGYHTTAAPDALANPDSHRETFFGAGILFQCIFCSAHQGSSEKTS